MTFSWRWSICQSKHRPSGWWQSFFDLSINPWFDDDLFIINLSTDPRVGDYLFIFDLSTDPGVGNDLSFDLSLDLWLAMICLQSKHRPSNWRWSFHIRYKNQPSGWRWSIFDLSTAPWLDDNLFFIDLRTDSWVSSDLLLFDLSTEPQVGNHISFVLCIDLRLRTIFSCFWSKHQLLSWQRSCILSWSRRFANSFLIFYTLVDKILCSFIFNYFPPWLHDECHHSWY